MTSATCVKQTLSGICTISTPQGGVLEMWTLMWSAIAKGQAHPSCSHGTLNNSCRQGAPNRKISNFCSHGALKRNQNTASAHTELSSATKTQHLLTRSSQAQAVHSTCSHGALKRKQYTAYAHTELPSANNSQHLPTMSVHQQLNRPRPFHELALATSL